MNLFMTTDKPKPPNIFKDVRFVTYLALTASFLSGGKEGGGLHRFVSALIPFPGWPDIIIGLGGLTFIVLTVVRFVKLMKPWKEELEAMKRKKE